MEAMNKEALSVDQQPTSRLDHADFEQAETITMGGYEVTIRYSSAQNPTAIDGIKRVLLLAKLPKEAG